MSVVDTMKLMIMMTHLEDGVVGNGCQICESGTVVEDDATAAISGAYAKKSPLECPTIHLLR
jgi:hypothetical protein